jgi:hypothetical protein
MGWKRHLAPLINDVGTGKRQLVLGAEPKVGLIILDLISRSAIMPAGRVILSC